MLAAAKLRFRHAGRHQFSQWLALELYSGIEPHIIFHDCFGLLAVGEPVIYLAHKQCFILNVQVTSRLLAVSKFQHIENTLVRLCQSLRGCLRIVDELVASLQIIHGFVNFRYEVLPAKLRLPHVLTL